MPAIVNRLLDRCRTVTPIRTRKDPLTSAPAAMARWSTTGPSCRLVVRKMSSGSAGPVELGTGVGADATLTHPPAVAPGASGAHTQRSLSYVTPRSIDQVESFPKHLSPSCACAEARNAVTANAEMTNRARNFTSSPPSETQCQNAHQILCRARTAGQSCRQKHIRHLHP